MLIGQAPGHMLYIGIVSGYDVLDMMSDSDLANIEKRHPEYFDVPTEWLEPGLSGLQNDVRTQKPATVE